MKPRRQQASITFQSDFAKDRLRQLVQDGRSQAEIIEDALRRMPLPAPRVTPEEFAERKARLIEILDRIPRGSIPSMAEFDAEEYDEHGDPR